MALNRPVMMPDGTVRDTHTVTCITHIISDHTVIDVTSTSEGLSSFITQLVLDVNTTMSLDDAYDIVEADPRFVEYVDEATEAIEALLPTLTDEQAETVTKFFPAWEVDTAYAVGDRRKYNDKLYRCVQAHTSQEGWEPPNVPALWTRTGADPAVIEEWIQPTGAQDAYNTGDKVLHNEKTWISTVDANVWEPGVYGWEEVTE